MVYESLASITINCTDKCNAKCPYCKHHEGKSILDLDKIVSIYEDSVTLQTNYVIVAGGEPLLHPDIHEIIKLGTKYGLFIYLLTNGMNLTSENLEKMKMDGLAAIRLTLDSVKSEVQDRLKGKGALDTIKSAIDKANYAGVGININSPIGLHNLDEIDEMVKFCIDKKIRTLRISPLIESSKETTKKILKEIINAHKKYVDYLFYDDFAEYTGYNVFLETIKSSVCPGSIISININANGNITKCPYVEEAMGNVYENNLLSTWMNGYEDRLKDITKCVAVNFDIYEMFRELQDIIPERIVEKCISAWTYQIKGKKKLCFRDLPCWYFLFK